MGLATRTLGRTGLEVTRLGYGAMELNAKRKWGLGQAGETDKFVIAAAYARPWERYQFLRGSEQALMDNSVNAVKGLIADLEKMGLL